MRLKRQAVLADSKRRLRHKYRWLVCLRREVVPEKERPSLSMVKPLFAETRDVVGCEALPVSRQAGLHDWQS